MLQNVTGQLDLMCGGISCADIQKLHFDSMHQAKDQSLTLVLVKNVMPITNEYNDFE